MSIVQYTDEEFNVFYYGLKNNFKTTSKIKSVESEEFEYYSESVKLNIDSYYESIFGQRYNSSLIDHYKQVFYEDEDERNSKIISQVIDDFYYSLNYYYTVEIQSRYSYFLKPLSIEKKLGFQEGDAKFKNFIIKLILQQMRFQDGNFILLDKTSGTIINALIAECVQNIRREMIQNTLDLDCNDLINDINKLELEKNVGPFDFLVKSINLLRILKDDIKDQYAELKRINQPQLSIKTKNNHFTDISNTICNLTPNNNTDTNPQNKKRNLPLNDFEKKAFNRKLKIEFSPYNFRDLLIVFFKNAGIQIDSEKKDKIERFILNTVEFDRISYASFKGSPSETTINFFDNKKVTICKFCAVLLILMKKKVMSEIGAKPLQKILVKELEGINKNRIGISEDLRNKIRENLDGLTIDKLAQYAGFKNLQEIIGLIKS